MFFACYFQFWWTAEHIPGADNTLADAISRNNLKLFLTQASPTPGEQAVVPSALADMLSQDTTWTSTNWIPSFRSTNYSAALTASTHKTYRSVEARYLQFCQKFHIKKTNTCVRGGTLLLRGMLGAGGAVRRHNKNLLVGGETGSDSSWVCGPSTVGNAKVTTDPSWGTSRTGEGGVNPTTPPTNYPRDFEENEDSLGIGGRLLGHDNAVGRFIEWHSSRFAGQGSLRYHQRRASTPRPT